MKKLDFKIAHIADVQVKNRDKNLYIPYKKSLDSIVTSISSRDDISCIVISGDLFEYPEPNDSERKLIYDFLTNLSNIESLKEIVLIAGNHDLVKQKKADYEHTNSNAINIFVDIINNIKHNNKFIYLGHSGVYESRISEYINYISYSLEDKPTSLQKTDINHDKINICVFHAMIQEFVNDKKIPLRKDIIEHLKTLKDFPDNSIVMAGDIHMKLCYKDPNRNVTFFYPGSTQQHNHNEGDYIYFDKRSNDIIGEDKNINVYSLSLDDSDKLIIDTEYIHIPNYVIYQTIQISEKSEILATRKGIEQTYIKIKCPNSLNKDESQIRDLLRKMYDNKCYVTFDYDKITKEIVETQNPVIKEIINEVKELNNDLMDSNISDNLNDNDNLILSNTQLEKMFCYVMEKQLSKITSDDYDYINDSLKSIFRQQLDLVVDKSRRYSVKFESISCNQFMALGPNNIQLDYPGIVRILGTNGIGKTTLFRMIRWVLTGMIYEGMKSNTTVQNNIKIFNKSIVSNDDVIVKLYIKNNDVPMIIERRCQRKWKNNVGIENKLSKNCQNYISTITSDLIVTIRPGESNEKVISGNQAQKNIDAWFGDVINTIMFINQMKIEEILKNKNFDINDIILQFIGANYLTSLEDNLEFVKDDLYSIPKPTSTIEQLNDDIHKITNIISDTKCKIESSKDLLNDNKQKLNIYKTKQQQISDDLIKMGDIPSQIKKSESIIESLNKSISSFEIREYKIKKEWDKTLPSIDNNKDSEYKNSIKNLKNKSNQISLDIDNKNTQINNIKESIHRENIDIRNKIDSDIEDKNNTIKIYNQKISDNIELIRNIINNHISTINQEIISLNSEISGVFNQINSVKDDISDIEYQIMNGVCPTCHRPFSDDYDDIKEKLENNIKTLNSNLQELSDKSNQLETKITHNNKLIDSGYNKILKDLTNINQDFVDNYKHKKIWLEISDYIVSILDYKTKISESEELISNIKQYKYLDNDKINIHNNPYITEKYKTLIQSLDNYQESIQNLTNEKNRTDKELTIIDNEYSYFKNIYETELDNYHREYELFIQENKKINEYNKSIDDDKLVLYKYQTQINSEKERLLSYRENENEYNTLRIEYNDVNESISQYTENIDNINNEISKSSVYLSKLESDNEQLHKDLDNIVKYKRNDLIYKIYSKLIKTSFRDIVFEYYKTYLNKHLDLLLEDVNFRLFWDNKSDLIMIMNHNGVTSYIPVTEASGMETIFTGLSLIYTISILNVKHTCSHIFIDELSGQLSTGKNLFYIDSNIKNYQELFVSIINKFKEKTIFIVDHNIDEMNETISYEVVSGEEGNKYITI